ncbi:conserved hypothetical protein [Ricinus communis]|uniref:Uncharacterized protein n=1 Tax=Ricinus communis TaxID=3988 RepID=B9SKY5_RICCO|nr:conserved hypothetical protein [Ricinus communis]|eukprot:XP_002526654.1 uncharacterized protein LOC8263097 [Ricinus communis]
MEEARKKATDANFPRKLDFSLPLLSTRRLGGFHSTSSGIVSQDASDGIPFCWERAPGKPKNTEQNDIHDGETPRPRLPPCRWQPEKKTSRNDNVNTHYQDDGCDADVDENGDEDEDDLFSDAVDILSLTEAIDIVQKAEDDHGLDRLNLESINSTESQSPNFMIERFLPDATALAASSVLYASRNLNNNLPNFGENYVEEYVSQTVGRSHSSEATLKGCGLEILSPWRMKHKLCGVKSPVRQVSPTLQSLSTAKQKKHCSTHSPSSIVSKKYI